MLNDVTESPPDGEHQSVTLPSLDQLCIAIPVGEPGKCGRVGDSSMV